MLKNYFIRTQGQIPLNNAALCPLNQKAASVMIESIQEMQSPTELTRHQWVQRYHKAHAIFASLLDCEPQSVTFLPNVASTMSLVASAFPLAASDRILVVDQEYASNAYPWREIARRTGAIVDVCASGPRYELDQEALESMISERTKIVAISWVQFQTGVAVDLKSLAHAAHRMGARVVVDATQGLGVSPLSMRESGIDMVAGSMHKWIGGPLGLAYLGIKSELIKTLRPITVGPYSFGQTAGTLDPEAKLQTSASRFLSGTPALVSIFGAAAAAQTILDVQVAQISYHALQLAQALHEGLESQGHTVISPFKKTSPIVTFIPGCGIQETIARLNQGGISFALRGGGIRLSPHAFNTEEDIARTLCLLEKTS